MSVIMIGVVVIRVVVIELIVVVIMVVFKEGMAGLLCGTGLLAPTSHDHAGGMNSSAVSTHACLMEYG